MIFKSNRLKTVFLFPAKAASTTAKTWFFEVERSFDRGLDEKMKGLDSVHDSAFAAANGLTVDPADVSVLLETGYRAVAVVRSPYTRLFSAITNKFIQASLVHQSHAGNYDFLNSPDCSNRKLAHVYDWYQERYSSDLETIQLKHLVDFACNVVEHDYKIDEHIAPIINSRGVRFLMRDENTEMIDVETEDLVLRLNQLTGQNAGQGHEPLNQNVYTNGALRRPDAEYLNSLEPDKDIPFHCTYFRERVRQRFAQDFNCVRVRRPELAASHPELWA